MAFNTFVFGPLSIKVIPTGQSVMVHVTMDGRLVIENSLSHGHPTLSWSSEIDANRTSGSITIHFPKADLHYTVSIDSLTWDSPGHGFGKASGELHVASANSIRHL